MKHIIHEIRNQPHHVRALATVLCTVVVVAIVVAVWFNSFQKDIYALLNPEQQSQAEDQRFAKESKSLFSSILQTLDDGKAQILNLFDGESQTDVINDRSTSNNSIHLLPISGNR